MLCDMTCADLGTKASIPQRPYAVGSCSFLLADGLWSDLYRFGSVCLGSTACDQYPLSGLMQWNSPSYVGPGDSIVCPQRGANPFGYGAVTSLLEFRPNQLPACGGSRCA